MAEDTKPVNKAEQFDRKYGEQFQHFIFTLHASEEMLEVLGNMPNGISGSRLDAFYNAMESLPRWVKRVLAIRYNRRSPLAREK